MTIRPSHHIPTRCCASVWGCAQCVPAACHAAETRCPAPGGWSDVHEISMEFRDFDWELFVDSLVSCFEYLNQFESIWINLNQFESNHHGVGSLTAQCLNEPFFIASSNGLSAEFRLYSVRSSCRRIFRKSASVFSSIIWRPGGRVWSCSILSICPERCPHPHLSTTEATHHNRWQLTTCEYFIISDQFSSYFIIFHGSSGSSKAQTPRFSITKQHDFLCSKAQQSNLFQKKNGSLSCISGGRRFLNDGWSTPSQKMVVFLPRKRAA